MKVLAWLATHPRFRFYFTPVHCLWMNLIEQWFSILQRKHLRLADFASKDALRLAIAQFIDKHDDHAHPFRWDQRSVAKVTAWAQRNMDPAPAT